MSDARDWTTKRLAAAAGVSDARVRQALISEDLQGHKWGRDWVIPYEEGLRWLEERRKKSPT